MAEWDVVVIGAGPVGENVADRAVQGGLSVALVESELVGGECSYWACMPSKALLRPGAAARAAMAAGVRGAQVDPSAVLARRTRFTSDWDDAGQVAWVDGAGIHLVRGHGRLAGERRVVVDTVDGSEELFARHAVVIATGSDALVPAIPGLAASAPWTSREVTALEEVPRRVAVIGGGVVATEAATFLSDLGAEVILLARSTLLGGMEPFAGEEVARALRERGIDVRMPASPDRVTRDDTIVRIELAGEVIEVEEVVVATGRTPRTDDLGLKTVGLAAGSWLDTDDTLRVTGFDWLYAVGDVNQRALLTHQGKYQARAAGDVIAARATGADVEDAPWGRHVATADSIAVPQTVFTDPEVAAVGLTAAEAERRGLRVRVVDYDIGRVAGAALVADGYRGRARMIVDLDRDVLVGMTLLGPGVGELIHAATVAIVAEVRIARLWHAVPAYPLISEIWLRLLESLER